MRELVSYSLMSLSAVFFVVDPVGAVPFFLAMTRDDPVSKRRAMALRAASTSYVVLTVFALAGAIIFKYLGISLGAFKIAGGVLLLIMAVDMLRSRPSTTRITEGEVEAGAAKEDVAIVPLAMPLLAGPGSIATVAVLMGRARGSRWWLAFPVLGAILVTCIAIYLILAGASRVDRVLGPTGASIVERVAGLLLAAIAIQFMLDGLGDALPAMLRRV